MNNILPQSEAIGTLTTDRLILREWQETDAPTLFKYASDRRVRQTSPCSTT
jgi:RimJ/RimL family protein N-acetyltransferase